MQLKAEPEHAGKVVRCPGCNTKLQIPQSVETLNSDIPPPSSLGERSLEGAETPGEGSAQFPTQKPERHGWIESDPTNANIWKSFAIGSVCTLAFLGILLAFAPPPGMASSDYNLMQ